MFLTIEELRELTGWKRPAKVMEWLADNGYLFKIGGDGWPRVLREAVCASLSGQITKPEPRMHL
jgi:hypothetical protein